METETKQTAGIPVPTVDLHFHQSNAWEPEPRRSVYVRFGNVTINGKTYNSVMAHREEYPVKQWPENGEGEA